MSEVPMSSDRETTLREALDRICVDDWGPRGGRIVKGNAEIDDREAATFYRGYNAGIEGQFNKTREIAQQALASTPPASVPVTRKFDDLVNATMTPESIERAKQKADGRIVLPKS